jgi:hypothetical protein
MFRAWASIPRLTRSNVPERWVKLSGVLFVAGVMGVWLWLEATPAPRVKPASAQAIFIDKSPDAQTARKAAIDEFMAKGLIRRIDPGRRGELKVSVRPGFYSMEEEMRRKTVDVLYAYYFDGSSVNDTVILRDARHGNEVGQYNPYRGGLRMYK